jgi:hypothetical protein
VITNNGRRSNSHLSADLYTPTNLGPCADQNILSDDCVVTDMDQTVDLCPPTDPGRGQRTSGYDHLSKDLDVITYIQTTDMFDLLEGPRRICRIPESIESQYCTGMNHNPITESHPVEKHRSRADPAPIAKLTASDYRTGSDPAVHP